MELIALGTSASFPAAGGACSGYLVRHDSTELLLDCGTGVLSRLQQETTVRALTAIVISHFHPDHYIDLVPMRYGLHYGIEAPFRPKLYLPPGGIALLERIGIGLRNAPSYFSNAFDLHEYDPESALRLGSLSLTFQRTTHDEPTWAIAVNDGEHRFVYTADTRESDEVDRFASGADLLLCEATYPDDLDTIPSHNHLTSRQAGELAQRAGAARLVLTHFWPGIELSRYAADAATAFSGPIELAEPGLRFRIAKATNVMIAST